MTERARHQVSFSVLIVCTANKCRSPMAELMLRERVRDSDVIWHIESAGTRAHADEPIHPLSAQALTERGIESSSWRSRLLAKDAIQRADLILTAQSHHRSAVVTMVPTALARTFTLLQFARYVAAGDSAIGSSGTHNCDELLVAARRGRAQLQPVDTHRDDLKDPIGHRFRAYRDCASRIDTALATILTAAR